MLSVAWAGNIEESRKTAMNIHIFFMVSPHAEMKIKQRQLFSVWLNGGWLLFLFHFFPAYRNNSYPDNSDRGEGRILELIE